MDTLSLETFARRLVVSDTIEKKLSFCPASISIQETAPCHRIMAPGRPNNLKVIPGKKVKVPPIMGVRDKEQRARIIHALANHELQAAELFAWAIVAFGDTPKAFRRGLLSILTEEQEHCLLYIGLLDSLGHSFGDFPVTGHFWHKLDPIKTPLDFLCTMGLTYENANLDFANEYIQEAQKHSLTDFVSVLEKVHEEEIRHVAFAWRWFKKFKKATSSTMETYNGSVTRPLGLHRARGKTFDEASRIKAGLDQEFINACKNQEPRRPDGRPR